MRKLVYALLGVSAIALVLAPVALADGAGDPITGSGTTNLVAWEGIVAMVVPWVAALVVQSHWGVKYKQVIAWLVAGSVGYVTYGFTHGWHIDDAHFVVAIFTVLTGSKVFYDKYKKAFGLETFEQRTSRKKA